MVDEVFRSGSIVVADQKDCIRHIGSLPRSIPESVELLPEWVRISDLPTVTKAAFFHYEPIHWLTATAGQADCGKQEAEHDHLAEHSYVMKADVSE